MRAGDGACCCRLLLLDTECVLDSENRQLDEVCFSSGPWFFCFLGSEITVEMDGRTSYRQTKSFFLKQNICKKSIVRSQRSQVFFPFAWIPFPFPNAA